MKILTFKDIEQFPLAGSVVAIGNFDGVHRGHMEIFRRIKSKAAEMGLPAVVVTFEPHPLHLLAPEKAPLLITTIEQKIALIQESGVDIVVVVGFTREFSTLPADVFVSEYLCGRLGMRHIVIGHDYAFGYKRQGNVETLSWMGSENGFTIENLDPVGEGEVVFSSTLVRNMVSAGSVSAVTSILGRFHAVSGIVVHGREIGQMIGFPTANIQTFNDLMPADGVYAVMVAVGGTLFKGACSIGTNPSFGGCSHTFEVFLLDFSGELYGVELSVVFIERLREVQRFDSVAALIEAIGKDVDKAGKVLSGADMKMVKPLFTGRHIERQS